MPLLELSASTLSSLRLPAHIGRGDAAITRTARNESLFDVLTRLREDNEALQQRFAEPLEQPPQVQLEIGIVKGRLTDQNPLDRIALQRVAAEVLDLGVRKYLGGRRSVRCRILLQVRLELLARRSGKESPPCPCSASALWMLPAVGRAARPTRPACSQPYQHLPPTQP